MHDDDDFEDGETYRHDGPHGYTPSSEDMARAEVFDRRQIALEVLRLYPFRINGDYDGPTRELIAAARKVLLDHLNGKPA